MRNSFLLTEMDLRAGGTEISKFSAAILMEAAEGKKEIFFKKCFYMVVVLANLGRMWTFLSILARMEMVK
jgi:hypothetical protein